MDSLLSVLFGLAAFCSVPVYLIWQVLVLFRRRGWGLILSAVPILPMSVVMAQTVEAYRLESNLWPILLILSAPFAVLWLFLASLLFRGR